MIKAENAPQELLLPWVTQAALVKSRSVDSQIFEAVVQEIDAEPTHSRVQHGVPRLFPAWARESDHAEPYELRAAQSSTSFPARGSIELKAPPLDWLSRGSWSRPTFALSIRASMYQQSELAQTLPSGVPAVGELYNVVLYPGSFRSTAHGFVHLLGENEKSLWLTLPTADEAIAKWLEGRAFTATPSSAGRIARQMQRMLPTAFDARSVLRTPIIEMIADAARSPSRAVSEPELAKALGRIHTTHKERARRHRERLVDRGVIRPGMLVACPQCSQENWYAFDALAAVVECERCVSDFALPVSFPPKDRGWGFRLRGPFAVEGRGREGSESSLRSRPSRAPSCSRRPPGPAVSISSMRTGRSTKSTSCSVGVSEGRAGR